MDGDEYEVEEAGEEEQDIDYMMSEIYDIVDSVVPRTDDPMQPTITISLVGYVGKEPKFKPFGNVEGDNENLRGLWSFSLATNRYFKSPSNEGWRSETNWHSIKDFEFCDESRYDSRNALSVMKGALVQIDGRIKYYKTAEGKSHPQIIAQHVSVLKPAKKNTNVQQASSLTESPAPIIRDEFNETDITAMQVERECEEVETIDYIDRDSYRVMSCIVRTVPESLLVNSVLGDRNTIQKKTPNNILSQNSMSFRLLKRISKATQTTNTFSCSGSLAVKPSMTIFNHPTDSTKTTTSLQLDSLTQKYGGGQDSRITDFLQTSIYQCKVSTNLDLTQSQILHDIKLILAPDAGTIHAELQTLNVGNPTNHFGDTRWASSAHLQNAPNAFGTYFGNLILDLPSQYSGGALSIHRPRPRSVATLDWSEFRSLSIFSGMKDNSKRSNDMSQMINSNPITEGNRLALSYRLFKSPESPPLLDRTTIDVTETEVYKSLEAAIKNPSLQGTKIGIPCQSTRHVMGTSGPELQGVVAVVQMAGEKLGLSYQVVPVFRRDEVYCDLVGEEMRERLYIGDWEMVRDLKKGDFRGYEDADDIIVLDCETDDDVEWVGTDAVFESIQCNSMMVTALR
ncbi:UNVERIFIED_CONTAM: hypothetical protein HDU68_004780 [Siphonaria sp. JEL0065]|nr:hypothetical protein HDU68_004780 [Siphonaria sp. JEL0065]